jgi:hypothetical protein
MITARRLKNAASMTRAVGVDKKRRGTTGGSDMDNYPGQVEAFHEAIRRLVAVKEITTGLKDLTLYTTDTYSLPAEFGDLPHALLRRTGGGLENEAWANTELTLSRDESGWLTLEFLAWWVRDLSRSGKQIQLRPMALPPKANEVQFGETLKFILDQFAICDDDEPPLRMIQERADFLNLCIDLYADVLGELARPREGK